MEALRADLDRVGKVTDALEALVERIAAQRQAYADLFHFAADAQLVVDRFGSIEQANPAAARLMGASRLAGRPFAAFVAPKRRRELRLQIAALSGAAQWDTSLRQRDGTQRRVVAAARRMASGGICLVLREP